MSAAPSRPKRWIALVLAAGKGTRMKSELAKVLHEIEGKTLLSHVLETAARLPLARTLVVLGHQSAEVRERHRGFDFTPVLQEPQLGTGHAVMVAASELEQEPEGTSLLVLYGDVPLLRETTLRELMERHQVEGNGATVLTAKVGDPTGYGRILRDGDARFLRIVEDRDLSQDERKLNEINSGIYAFDLKCLLRSLAGLKTENAQGEYYLTDALEGILGQGRAVGLLCLRDEEEISGINTVEQLRESAAILARRRSGGEEGCPICELLHRREELILLRQDGLAVVVAPAPYNSGQLCVVPERHLVYLDSLSEEESAAMFSLGAEAEGWLEAAYRPQAFNFGYNSGRPGEHLALQIIPRWAGDANFMPLVGGVGILPETAEGTMQRVREARRRIIREGADASGESSTIAGGPSTEEARE